MKKIIRTSNAPEAIGPYSQASVHNNLVYCSGQLPLDPKTMEMVGQSITEQTEQVLKNLKGVLEAAGSRLENVLKCTIYLKDLKEFDVVNKIYGDYFPQNPPARATIEVSQLPKNALIEIDCIASI